jgi:hypothetical protein
MFFVNIPVLPPSRFILFFRTVVLLSGKVLNRFHFGTFEKDAPPDKEVDHVWLFVGSRMLVTFKFVIQTLLTFQSAPIIDGIPGSLRRHGQRDFGRLSTRFHSTYSYLDLQKARHLLSESKRCSRRATVEVTNGTQDRDDPASEIGVLSAVCVENNDIEFGLSGKKIY